MSIASMHILWHQGRRNRCAGNNGAIGAVCAFGAIGSSVWSSSRGSRSAVDMEISHYKLYGAVFCASSFIWLVAAALASATEVNTSCTAVCAVASCQGPSATLKTGCTAPDTSKKP
eukprot:6200653-Pleurochrysis_carterae.AAC.6